MAVNNFFFKVLAELFYFKCFSIFIFFLLTEGGSDPQWKIPLFFLFFFETLPYYFNTFLAALLGTVIGLKAIKTKQKTYLFSFLTQISAHYIRNTTRDNEKYYFGFANTD